MKLRNKKTGEIGWLYCDHISVPKKMTVFAEDKDLSANHWDYASLAELNEKWEDYEEPEGINEIDVVLDAIGEYCNEHSYYSGDLEKIKILNTVEEKLKAWKRLKEYGVKLNLDFVKNKIDFTYSINNPLLDVLDGEEQIFNNMKIVFGGKE